MTSGGRLFLFFVFMHIKIEILRASVLLLSLLLFISKTFTEWMIVSENLN